MGSEDNSIHLYIWTLEYTGVEDNSIHLYIHTLDYVDRKDGGIVTLKRVLNNKEIINDD